jgi:hypothetical protein
LGTFLLRLIFNDREKSDLSESIAKLASNMGLDEISLLWETRFYVNAEF